MALIPSPSGRGSITIPALSGSVASFCGGLLCPSSGAVSYTHLDVYKRQVQELSQKYPERKIYAVDSLCASLGQGLLVYLAAQERAKGKGIEEVRDWLETEKFHLCHWFTVEDLQFLKRGGRVSAATALVGTMLSIKPVMHMDNAGHLINVSKARGRRPSLTALVDRMEQLAIAPEEQTVFISHGD